MYVAATSKIRVERPTVNAGIEEIGVIMYDCSAID